MKIQMDFEDPKFYLSKLDTYKYLLENDPCWWNEQNSCWVITRYDDVTTMLRDHETFTTKYGISLKSRVPYGQVRKSFRFNEQNHNDYMSDRLIISKIFNYLINYNLENYIKYNTKNKLKQYINHGSFDIISNIFLKLPVDVICMMLGIEQQDVDYLVEWSEKIFDINDEEKEEEILNKLSIFFLKKIPKNINLISDEKICDRELSIKEKILYSLVFMIAGHSTVTSSMANLMYDVLKYTEEFKKIKDNRFLISSFIEESLRFSNTTPGLVRTCTKDYTLYNKVIREGDSVLISINAANLDPQKWGNNSYAFCIDRDFTKHNLAFGYGPHQCAGIKLARMQLIHLLEELINLNKIKMNNLVPKSKSDMTGTCWKNLYVELS